MADCERQHCGSETRLKGTTTQELLPHLDLSVSEETFLGSLGKMGAIDLLFITISHSVSFMGKFFFCIKQFEIFSRDSMPTFIF